MTEKKITAVLSGLFPDLASWDDEYDMFVWNECRHKEVVEFKPCEDRLATLALEDRLTGEIRESIYPKLLVQVALPKEEPSRSLGKKKSDVYWAINALPEHRAEAMVRAFGKWEDTEEDDQDSLSDFIISVNDGYVEYSYSWRISSDYSIVGVVEKITEALGVPPSAPGQIRAER